MTPTKTLIPQRRKSILHRPRLVEHIQRHIDGAMTLVSAPAGYGKTSLLVDLVADVPFPVCWLLLDKADRDIRAFVHNLIAAIQRRFPDFGEASLRALDANPNLVRNPDVLGNVVLQDLAENVSEFFVLILDDYHVIDRIGRAGRLLGDVAMSTSRRWHLVISGRTVPGTLPFSYLVAHDLIAFVGQDDLAFTNSEVQQFLETRHGLALTPEQAEDLVVASEGWITGIVLATSSAWRGIRDVLNQARAQDGPVYAYLAGQAFEEQSEALDETMLALSTLPEMNETLCHQALGLGGAGRVLEELERRGFFLTKVVDEANVLYYRYHHLFRDFLQKRLQEQDPGRFRSLHQRAAEWFEAQEQWDRAVAHRRAAGDERATAQTMENGARPMYLSGRLETLVAWYEETPEPLRAEFPRLLLFVSRALFDLGRADETIPLLHQAEATFRERRETKHVITALQQQATVRCVQGRYTEMLDMARKSLATLDVSESNAPILTAEAQRLIGLARFNLGQLEQAVEHLHIALDLHQALGGKRETAVACLDLALVLLRLGRLDECRACQDKALALYRSIPPLGEFAVALNDVAYGRHYLAGEYGQALSLFREALDIAHQVGSLRAQAFALLSTADLYRDLGALQEARERYAQAEELARQSGHADLLNFALVGTAQALVQTGDVIEALGMAAQARDQAQRCGGVYQLGLACLALGAIHIQAGDAQTALAELERGRDLLQQSGARRDLTCVYMLLARAHRAAGDVEAALESLRQALVVGIETQTFHHLVVEGQHVFDLLRRLLQQNPADRRPAQIMDRIRTLPAIVRQITGKSVPAMLSLSPTLRFYGFGTGRMERDGQPVAWNSAKARYMAFYLLTHSPRSRDQLFAVFWPDAEHNTARSAFHCTKWHVQKALGRRLIVYEDGLYKIAWDPDCWFDVAAFESLLDEPGRDRQARLEEAVSLYQRDFLKGYDAEWCLLIRERLRMRCRDALVELGELYMEKGEFRLAFFALNRAMSLDDFYEPTIRALMRLHALDGQPHLALDISHRLEQRLRRELNTSLAQETQSLRQSIQASI
jgi:LuxR family maltose regulon positive regulatory protein